MLALEHVPAILPVMPPTSRAVRAEGLHLSTILHDLCATLEPSRFEQRAVTEGGVEDRTGQPDLEQVPQVWLGMAFEERLERTLDAVMAPLSFRPTELRCDGIYMNPDRLSFDPPRAGLGETGGPDDLPPVVEEHKLTWMSGREDATEAPKFRHYWWQLMAYCYALGTPRGRLRGFFVNADYRYQDPAPDAPGSAYRYRVWDVRFTPQELQDNWQMIKGHAARRGW